GGLPGSSTASTSVVHFDVCCSSSETSLPVKKHLPIRPYHYILVESSLPHRLPRGCALLAAPSDSNSERRERHLRHTGRIDMCSSSLEVQVVRWAHGQRAGRTYHFEGRCPLDKYTPSGQAFTSP
ncbi:unnamed protein product, partial [Ectocarpus sp. 6 AP-2014]